ncbi:MAG: hypothetical protein WA786_04740 [Acidimicrobiales bacterium]
MSYELVFWRQEAMMSRPSREVYELLRSGERVEGLATLPLDDFLARIIEVCPGAVRQSDGATPSIDWDGGNGEDSFRVTWSDQHVLIDCRHVALDVVNSLVDVATAFSCPLYDPQTGERFRLVGP